MDANQKSTISLSEEEKRLLLTSLLLKKKEALTFPLSFSQQRLWFLDQLSFGNLSYNMLFALSLSFSLNFQALERSLNAIVQRHEILRTHFVSVEGTPVQKISTRLNVNLPVIDLQFLSDPVKQRQALLVLADQRAQQFFDLQNDPLFTVDVVCLKRDEQVLFLSLHHIIFDGWSANIFMHELETFYGAFANEQSSMLPSLPIQYSDFAVWQQNWMQTSAFERQLAYWRKQLENLPTLSLPVDYTHISEPSTAGSEYSIDLPSPLVEGLKALCLREKTTPFMLLLAAFQILLQRYTNQDDIPIGIDVLGRNRKELEGLIGFFINALVFRTDLSNNPTFLEVLHDVRQHAIEAFENQDLPFDKLVEELQPERVLGLNPLFQSTFSYQDFRSSDDRERRMKFYPLGRSTTIAKFDLSLHLIEDSTGLHATLSYKTDLFKATTIMRMLNHYQILLESIVAHPDRSIATFSLLSAEERSLLLQQNNDTQISVSFDEDLPSIDTIVDTHLGRIAAVTIPVLPSQVYTDKKKLLDILLSSLNFSKQIHATTVSLMGLLASATNYGQDLVDISTAEDFPSITTGHGTTTASIVLSCENILALTGRTITKERIGMLGLGSIGLATLRLVLKILPHPTEILLCDIYSRQDRLEDIRQELFDPFHFQGDVRICTSVTEVPTDFYDATLIIGATNVPDVLDIHKVKPGTLIVDDSAPHCFNALLAIKRLVEKQDVLFTGGGVLKSPQPLNKLTYIPYGLEKALTPGEVKAITQKKSDLIGSCVMSSLLSARFEYVPATIGFIDAETSYLHYQAVKQHGFQAAPLHSEIYFLDERYIQQFKRSFAIL